MKRRFAFLCAAVLALPAFADVYSSALQRARDLKNQNNASQGVTPPGAPPQNTPPPPPPDPVLTATLQNIARLQTDLALLETDPGRKQPLINDLNAAAQGAHPTAASVSKLADVLASVLGGKHFSQDQLKKLAQYLHASFNGSHLSQIQQQTIFDDMQKILQGGGVAADDATKAIEGAKAVVAETK